jgi:hypothetical protein
MLPTFAAANHLSQKKLDFSGSIGLQNIRIELLNSGSLFFGLTSHGLL